MKKTILFIIVISAIAFLNVIAEDPKTGEEINWQVISNGGTNGTSTNYGLKGTVGQTAVGQGTSASYGLKHGFWQTFTSGGQPCEGRCGDANADASVNVSDAVYIINYVFITGSPEPLPVKACGDANSDASVNVSDAVYIINYVFIIGSPAPGDCNLGSWPGGDCCPF
jgi:hypothetical protein